MNSTLGRYAPITAAVTGVGVVFAYVFGVLLGIAASSDLQPMALLAIGAIFGSAVVANGHKEPLRQAAAANARLDMIGAPHTANVTTIDADGASVTRTDNT